MIYTKDYEFSKIPTFVLDITDLVKICQVDKDDGSAKVSESLKHNIANNVFNLIKLDYANFAAKKILNSEYDDIDLYITYCKNFIFKKSIDNIFDIIKFKNKIIECIDDSVLNENIFYIVCSEVVSGNYIYIIFNVICTSSSFENKYHYNAFVEKYYLLVDSIDDAMIIVDVNHGVVIEYNKAAFSLLNILSNNTDLYHYDFYCNDDKREYLEFYNDILTSGVNKSREFNITINEIIIPVKIKISFSFIGNLKVAQIIFVDLSTKNNLENRRRLLAAAIDQVADPIIITDKCWKIEYVNSSYESSNEVKLDEIYGNKIEILKDNFDNISHYKLMLDEILSGRVWRGNVTNKNKNGEVYFENVTISPVVNNNGTVANFVIIKRDVTKHVLLENQIRQSQKMHAIGMLAGGIAHDFNNILTSILGFAELCKLQTDEKSIIYSNIDEIINASLRAEQLVDQILKFSRNKDREISKFAVSTILKEVLRLIKVTINPEVKITLKIVDDPEISGDPNQIHQILMNLCTNAWQSLVGEQGGIDLSLFSVLLSPQEAIVIGRLLPGRYACIQIKDNGIGIPKEYIPRIFDPYFTTKKLNEGNGLGLSVVHGIVNDHRGAITVESEVGEGSCFRVYLPESVNDGKE